MPANISIENGRAAVMVVRKPAWHGLGSVLDRPATAAEAIEAAHLDWRVTKKQLFAGEEQREIEDFYAVVREDYWQQGRHTALGLVTAEYTPLQNADAFSFFDPIVGQGAAVYHTAGALGNGERVWMLAKLPDEIRVIGDDIAHKYLLLSNSHDGKSAVQIKFTPIRVVCQNTLMTALRQGPALRVAHTRDLRQRLEVAACLLKSIQFHFDELETVFQRMAKVPMNERRVAAYLQDVFPDPRRGADIERYERVLARTQRDRAAAEYYFAAGAGNTVPGTRGTLWAAYNGAVEYVDYRRHEGSKRGRQLSEIWFGEGYSAKVRAFRAAENLMSATRH